MNKQKIYILLTAVILSGALFTVPPIYAQTPGGNPHMNFFQEFIQFIAQKFGLDKTLVQTAITDFQQQKKATITPRPALTYHAQSLGIDSSYIMPGLGKGMGGRKMMGRGKGWGFGERGENISPTPAQ